MSEPTDSHQPPLQLQFMNITGADMARLQQDNEDTDTRENPREFQYFSMTQDPTSGEEGDFDLSSTMGGSNAASPEQSTNPQQQPRARARNPLADCRVDTAMPEYLANKRTKDGKVPKKRGPKPDSKPARDRRQELNRQAQRAHRLRKEEMFKWLEDGMATATQRAAAAEAANEQLQQENERLRQLLNADQTQVGGQQLPQSAGASSVSSPAERESAASSDPKAIQDHDQAAVEFILALEANCEAHKTYMSARSFNDGFGDQGGHCGMLTKVPIDVAKNHTMGEASHPHELPDVGEAPGKYARLLNLVPTKSYPTLQEWKLASGEISPAQAIRYIRKDPRYAKLNAEDFAQITSMLKDRCRCYGFGAVVEVYEVQEALDELFRSMGLSAEDGFGVENPIWRTVPLSNPHTMNGPMYPALNTLMKMDLADLMSKRHAEQYDYMVADHQTMRESEARKARSAQNSASVSRRESRQESLDQSATEGRDIVLETVLDLQAQGLLNMDLPTTLQQPTGGNQEGQNDQFDPAYSTYHQDDPHGDSNFQP